MSYKTRYFSGQLLDVLNNRLEEAGYQTASKNYGVNLSNQYRGEVDHILKDVSEMEHHDVANEAIRIKYAKEIEL